MSQRLFCFGLGFSARTLARGLQARGWQVAGTVRSESSAEALAGEGFELLRLARDLPLPDLTAALAGTTHLLSSVAPDEAGDPVLDLAGPAIAACKSITWAGYLSTTGVYGSRDGGWVDESAELRPSSPRSRRRAAAEAAWLDLWRQEGLPVHLFRLAGIYGPGRNTLETIRQGKARRIDRPGQVFSRIHVEDIAQVLKASMARPNPGTIYNVCDDAPAEPAEVIAFASRLLGLEPPPLVPFEEADLSPMARTFWLDNKRVSNRRLKEELGVSFAYPSYREGLTALLEAE